MALSTTQYGYIIDPMVPFTDDKGKTIKNGFVRVFVAGSSTPVITYRNFDGATNQDRIELDNSGRTRTSVIGSKGLTYKVCVYDKHHSQESPILTVDNVSAIGANITAGSGATVVTGLDGLTTKPDGFVDASVVGTDGYVAIDHTLVTDDLNTDAKVTAVEDDRYIPLLNEDVNDPDSKMTLGRLWKWVLGKIKSLPTTITSFRTGDVIPVDGPSGTAKIPAENLAMSSVQDELVENVGYLVDDAFLEQSDFWTETTISNTGVESASTTRISSKPFIITDKTSREIYCTNKYWASRWNADGTFIDLYVVDPVTPVSLPNGIYRLTAHYADNRTIDSSNVDALIESFSFKRNLLTGENIEPHSIIPENLKENPFAEHDMLDNADFWSANTISNSGVVLPSTTRISTDTIVITENTPNVVKNSSGGSVFCWITEFNVDGTFKSMYSEVGCYPSVTLTKGYFRITAKKSNDATIDDTEFNAILSALSLGSKKLDGSNIDDKTISGEKLKNQTIGEREIKDYPFAEHDMLDNADFWSANTISNSGVVLPSTTRISTDTIVITENTPNVVKNSSGGSVFCWITEFNVDGTFKSMYSEVGYYPSVVLTEGYFRITAKKSNDATIDDTEFNAILSALSLGSKKLDGSDIDDRTISGEKLKNQTIGEREIKDYPFAEHNILNNDDFWSATTISNTGVESASTTRISSSMIEITSDTPNTIKNSSAGSVEYWVSKYGSDGTFIETSTIVGYYELLTLANGYYRITARKSNNATIDSTEKANILAALYLFSKRMDGSKIERDSIPADRIKGGSDVSMLKGKSVLNLGDSIANGAGDNSGGAYAKYIAAKNSMRLYTYAVNGMVLAEGGSDTTSSRLSQQITSAIAGIPNDITPDFILFEGGTNDIHTNVTLGDLVSDVNAYGEYVTTGCDTDTYCGAFEVAVNRLRTQWPSASIIFVMVHEMTSRDITKQQQFHEKQLALCKKWKIPYVDMYNEGQMSSLITATAQNFFPTSSGTPTGYDRTHPNELGYKKFYCPKIEAKMRETCGWDVQ